MGSNGAAAQLTDSAFAFIKPGTFRMGDPTLKDAPIHTVTITHAFLLQKTEVTQAQWMEVMGGNPSFFGHCGPTCPVENVSYDTVQAFIARLNAMTGIQYRLPTEAEWEYAARAGTTGDYGTFGDVTDGAWVAANSEGTTHPVGLLRPNAWGLYDMEGNVWEWVSDWYGPYPSGPVDDPTGPSSGTFHVLRGGSWFDPVANARSAPRNVDTRTDRSSNYGFRLARTP
jgi:formylglycine-generating enzyme required for sulfatase activity